MCRVVVTERTNTSSVMAVVLVWGKSSFETPSRERKNLTRAERESSFGEGKHEDKHSRRHITKRTIEGQKKEKKGTPFFSSVFESFEFFERFSTAGRSSFSTAKQRGRSKIQDR